jgi:hypothetical protein
MGEESQYEFITMILSPPIRGRIAMGIHQPMFGDHGNIDRVPD